MTSSAAQLPEKVASPPPGVGRALVIRIGALGDLLLTRRLTYSLSRSGLRSTLLAPARHASLMESDSWIEGVLDSESPGFAGAFAGEWPAGTGAFDLAVVISDSEALARAAQAAAVSVVQIQTGPSNSGVSIARQWAEVVSPWAPVFEGALPRLAVPPQGEIAGGATLIHPGSGSPQKNWPVDLFVELSRTLRQTGHRIAWIRGPAEAVFPSETSEFRVLDRPSLATLGSTLARSRLFVGNDSGVSHLAAAVGAPTLALFGPTSDVVWRPQGPRVVAVRSPSGGMEGLALVTVLDGIDQLATLHGPAGQ